MRHDNFLALDQLDVAAYDATDHSRLRQCSRVIVRSGLALGADLRTVHGGVKTSQQSDIHAMLGHALLDNPLNEGLEASSLVVDEPTKGAAAREKA